GLPLGSSPCRRGARKSGRGFRLASASMATGKKPTGFTDGERVRMRERLQEREGLPDLSGPALSSSPARCSGPLSKRSSHPQIPPINEKIKDLKWRCLEVHDETPGG